MKKRFGFASLFLSLFLLVTMIGCSGGAAPVDPVDPVVPGSTENTYDFKVVSVDTTSATVSWKKDKSTKSDSIYQWILSVNEPVSSYYYDSISNYLSDDVITETVTGLKPGVENKIYLNGFTFSSKGGNYTYTKVYEAYITVTTEKEKYFSSISASPRDGYVYLSWSKAISLDTASKIIISKKTDEEDDFVTVVEITDSTTYYSDTKCEFETEYTYKFEAFDADDNLLDSKITTVTTNAMSVPSKITSITAIEYIDGWELTWTGKSGATKYVVGEFTSSSSTEPVRTWEVTEPSFFYSRDITKSADVYIKIDVYNPKGNSGYCSSKNIYTFSTGCSVSVAKTESSQTSVKVTCSDINIKKAKVEYAVRDKNGSYFLCEYQDDKEFEVKDLSFGATTDVRLYVKLTYNTPDGVEKTYENYKSISLTTKSFEAPEPPVVKKVGHGSATVSFTPLKEEQLYGVDPSNVIYVVKAYKENATTGIKTEHPIVGSTDPLFVGGLAVDTNYQFTVYAYVNGSSVYGDESEKCETVTTKAALSKPTVENAVENTRVDNTALKTSIVVTINQIDEDAEEEIEYGIKYALSNDLNAYLSAVTEAAEYSDSGYTYEVNAGNKLYIFAYAQEKNNVFSRVYSESSIKLELDRFNDLNIGNAIYLVDEESSYSEMVDFGNILQWKNSNGMYSSNESTSNIWNMALVSFASGGATYMAKVSLSSSLLGKHPYIIFLDETYGSKYNNVDLKYGDAWISEPSNRSEKNRTLTFLKSSTQYLSGGTSVSISDIYGGAVYVLIKEYMGSAAVGLSYYGK